MLSELGTSIADINNMSDFHQLMNDLLERERLHQYRTPAPLGQRWFELNQGQVPVLVSAPHACMHDRDGNRKMEEEFTGAIAQYLSASTGCHSIYSVYQATEDPNWHTDSEYKRAIARQHDETGFKFVIDLHGMLNRHGMGVAVGTMRNRSSDPADATLAFQKHGFLKAELADLELAKLEQSGDNVDSGLRLVVDHPRFTGGLRNHTVTRFASEELGIPAVQIELASSARVVFSAPTEDWPQSYTGNQSTIAATVRALETLIKMKTLDR